MTTIEHSQLTGAQLHEPKGVSGASAGTYYVADGASGGSWTSLWDSTSDTSISADSEVELTGLSAYSFLVIVTENLGYDTTGSLDLTVGNSGGYTADYTVVNNTFGGQVTSSSSSAVNIMSDSTTGSTYYLTSVTLVTNFNKDRYSIFTRRAMGSSDSSHTATTVVSQGFARANEEDAYDRIKIAPSSGTLTGTAIRVFGWKGTSEV